MTEYLYIYPIDYRKHNGDGCPENVPTVTLAIFITIVTNVTMVTTVTFTTKFTNVGNNIMAIFITTLTSAHTIARFTLIQPKHFFLRTFSNILMLSY